MSQDKYAIEALKGQDPVKDGVEVDITGIVERAQETATIFRRRILAAVTVSAALTIGLISALAGAGTGQLAGSGGRLALTSGGGASKMGTSVGARPTLMICEWCLLRGYSFTDGGLSNLGGTGPVYTISGPKDAAGVAQVVSSYLGVAGIATATGSVGGDTASYSGGGVSVFVAGAGAGSLYVLAPSGVDLVSGAAFSVSGMTGAIEGVLGVVGVHYELVDPVVSSSPTGAVTSHYIEFHIVLDGHKLANVSVTGEFNESGGLVSLSTPLFHVTSRSSYTLISPASGVRALNARARAIRQSSSDQSPGSAPTTSTGGTGPGVGNPGGPMVGGAGSVAGGATGGEGASGSGAVQNVTLSSATLEWYLSGWAGPGLVVIPVYVYTGELNDGLRLGSTFQIPGLESSEVTGLADWSPYLFWVYGKIMPMMYSGVG